MNRSEVELRALPTDAFEQSLLAFGAIAQSEDMACLDAVSVARIARAVFAARPKGLLVFGCGRDTPFWMAIGTGVPVLFVEDHPDWLESARRAGANVVQVHYKSELRKPMPSLTTPDGVPLDLWGVVIVDAPTGAESGQHGREQSIYAAALARRNSGAAVFVHDYERTWELACCNRFLGPPHDLLTDTRGRQLAAWV